MTMKKMIPILCIWVLVLGMDSNTLVVESFSSSSLHSNDNLHGLSTDGVASFALSKRRPLLKDTTTALTTIRTSISTKTRRRNLIHPVYYHQSYFSNQPWQTSKTSDVADGASSFTAMAAEATSYTGEEGGFSETGTGTTEKEVLFESFGKGIVRDFKARLPLFGSDIKDGLNMQCFAATMFLFFACLSPAVGFGALFGVATNGAIGTVEMVGSTALCGVIYALTSAQPCTIIGSTGPVLSFVICLVQLAKMLNLPFLPLYTWTGLWTALILFISSVTSASTLVKYLTRFTDEIFSTLISVIFVVEATSGVLSSFSSTTIASLTTPLLTVVCAATTFVLANVLKSVRKTTFFNKTIRTAVSNFAPTIGVAVATYAAWLARQSTIGGTAAALPTLAMPSTFGTTTGRPWLVPLWDLPMWGRWFASIPALMATVLLFLDQNITVRLVNNPRWKMKKGRRENNFIDGMHLDMLVISLLTAMQSILGIPWLVAATVRSLSHVGALSQYNSKGEVVGTREQRVTGVAIHGLIGLSILLDKPRQLLTQIPLPVLLGLFMYLGTATLPGNEMWERFLDLFRWDKEKTGATDRQRWKKQGVPDSVSRNFTLIQLACLGAMFCVKESKVVGVLFPILIALLAPIRFGLEKLNIIPKKYMDVLDED